MHVILGKVSLANVPFLNVIPATQRAEFHRAGAQPSCRDSGIYKYTGISFGEPKDKIVLFTYNGLNSPVPKPIGD